MPSKPQAMDAAFRTVVPLIPTGGDLSEALSFYRDYQSIAARIGPLELKPWGRREFHIDVAPTSTSIAAGEAGGWGLFGCEFVWG